MIALQTIPEMREPITSGTRSNLVDIVKGVAIILVTLGHTAQGMVHRGWWNTPSASFFRALIYSFHMPAFFFIAGLFVHGSIEAPREARLHRGKSKVNPLSLSALRCHLHRTQSIDRTLRDERRALRVADPSSSRLPMETQAGSSLLSSSALCWLFSQSRFPIGCGFLLAAAIGVTPAFGPPLTNQVLREFCFLAAGMWVRNARLSDGDHTSAICRGLQLRSAGGISDRDDLPLRSRQRDGAISVSALPARRPLSLGNAPRQTCAPEARSLDWPRLTRHLPAQRICPGRDPRRSG